MASDQADSTVAQQSPAGDSPAVRFDQLKVSAMREYALKNYSAAAEMYSEAAELQDEINGEMAPENADVLYQYGRSLYHVGVSKSDVLGGKVAQQDEPKRKKRKIESDIGTASIGDNAGRVSNLQESKAGPSAAQIPSNGPTTVPTPASKPFFQITGDENWTDSEEEEGAEDADAEEQGEEEDDDLAIAYEILDTARVLFRRNIENFGDTSTAAKEAELRTLRERLADTLDLQAEIKLENEQFFDAVNDSREALAIRLELFPQESGMVAEGHYKLSIALDFASLPTQPAEDAEHAPTKHEEGQVDEALRQEAAEEMEKAIMSCQAKVKKEEAKLAGLEGHKQDSVKRSIADTQDMIKEMNVRLADLRSTPASMKSSLSENIAGDKGDFRGIMGELLGSSKAEQSRLIQQATEQANDLSRLVKQKKKPKPESAAELDAVTDENGKRKAEDDESEARATGKKVKFEVEI